MKTTGDCAYSCFSFWVLGALSATLLYCLCPISFVIVFSMWVDLLKFLGLEWLWFGPG